MNCVLRDLNLVDEEKKRLDMCMYLLCEVQVLVRFGRKQASVCVCDTTMTV